jgi:phage shock protein A
MAVFERIGTIIRANLNDLLTRAEDPEKIINQTLMDMRQAQYEARMEVAEAIAEGKRLERDQLRHAGEVDTWLQKAEQALKAGRDDLAREALRRKQASADLAAGLKEQLDAHQSMVERLKTQLRALDAKIDEAERKRQLLIARQKRAEAQRSLSAAMARTDTAKAFEAFDRMESKVEAMEDKVAAEDELAHDLSLDDDFAALEVDDGVEDELAALKAKLEGEPGG